MSSLYSATHFNPNKQSPCRTDNCSTTTVHYHNISGGKQIRLTPSQPVPVCSVLLPDLALFGHTSDINEGVKIVLIIITYNFFLPVLTFFLFISITFSQ